MCQACVRSVVLYGSEHVSGMCQECCSLCSEWQSGVLFSMVSGAGVRSVVLYGSEMAGVRHVSGVLFSMVVRWQVSGMCQECCSLW